MTALFQSEHLNLLVGAGLSTAVQLSATAIPRPQSMGWITDLKVCKLEIEAYVDKTAKAASNLDATSVADELNALIDQGWTVAKLAHELGKSARQVYRWLEGAKCKEVILRKISALSVPLVLNEVISKFTDTT
ncbi:MAG: helix-turn-helix domain-containing protein [Nitrosomonas sp.]|uniref:helix-turn-helix domain-containing protein n=1 Tax=Nitrosomonas sp. TaxID=42353 RepID=UPI0025DF71D2|nr:helix-turn-helix domain-containing protein [Nitrosomonas sp.]MDP3279776.1 helix-turn-helix domain-containing protein [Nitrosomonas sp.]MDP3662555.1 helix-turn-helix domain-containing protein [Nitrosomonas sp.]MDZ4106942.1 helix-turn-helix domain-containing protein [Nitrosomonas sp.]HRB46508.1 helix-turn-helix domain-containing protein [Nitrosomonas sp.]